MIAEWLLHWNVNMIVIIWLFRWLIVVLFIAVYSLHAAFISQAMWKPTMSKDQLRSRWKGTQRICFWFWCEKMSSNERLMSNKLLCRWILAWHETHAQYIWKYRGRVNDTYFLWLQQCQWTGGRVVKWKNIEEINYFSNWTIKLLKSRKP